MFLLSSSLSIPSHWRSSEEISNVFSSRCFLSTYCAQAWHVSAIGELWTEWAAGVTEAGRVAGGAEGLKLGPLGVCMALPFIGQVPLGFSSI